MRGTLLVGVIAFIVAFLAGYPLLHILRTLKIGKQIRLEGPGTHFQKTGTPTMGGVLIWGTVFICTAVFNVIDSRSILVPLLATGATGSLGALDDVLGLMGDTADGLSAWTKFIVLWIIAILTGVAIYGFLGLDYIFIPFVQAPMHVGLLIVPLAAFAIVATANAVNLTDGVDSLAGVCAAMAFVAYGIIAHVQEQDPLATFCFTVVGATLAFLWFNAYPAWLFMGDTGSLALGASLATVALMTGHILLLPVIGFVFVAEAISVMSQVAYFKLTGGRRLFRMAPLHHHFELAGWSETHVSQRFWLMSMVACMAGVALARV